MHTITLSDTRDKELRMLHFSLNHCGPMNIYLTSTWADTCHSAKMKNKRYMI